MIVEKATLSKLKEFGLNSYESKVWVALLSRGISSAGELSDIANVPRSRSYDVLESLEKKGFVIMKVGKPIKYIAVSPVEALERVKKRIKFKAHQEEKMLEELKRSTLLQELTLLHSRGIDSQDPSEITGSIKGRESIQDHLVFQIKNARESIDLATSENGLIRKTKFLLKHFKKAKDRGVKIKIAAPFSSNNKESRAQLLQYAELVSIDSSKRFCITDNEQLTFFLTDDAQVHPSSELAIWLNSPYFAKSLKSTLH